MRTLTAPPPIDAELEDAVTTEDELWLEVEVLPALDAEAATDDDDVNPLDEETGTPASCAVFEMQKPLRPHS